MPPKRHFFVCLTQRPPFAKPSCGAGGSHDVLAALQEALDEAGLSAEVAVTGSQCLGPCDSGPTLVVYPEGVWYAGVKPTDARELIESHARDGKPVDRLRYSWPG